MKQFEKHIFFTLSIFFFSIAVFLQYELIDKDSAKRLISRFQVELNNQEAKLSEYLNAEEKKLEGNFDQTNFFSVFSNLNQPIEKEGLGYVIFHNQQMIYWSNNHISFPELLSKLSGENQLVALPNGIHWVKKRVSGQFTIYGLIHLKNNFTYENQFLENRFIPPFNLPSSYQLSAEKSGNSIEILNLANQYIFSIQPTDQKIGRTSTLYFPAFLFLMGFLFLLLAIYIKLKDFEDENFFLKMIVLLILLIVVYWAHLLFKIPGLLYYFKIFSPGFYAFSYWIPSLGDFFLITIMFFFWSIVFVKEFNPEKSSGKIKHIFYFVFVAGLYQLVDLMIANLISNSNINFKLNRITDIDLFIVGSFLSIAMLLLSVFIINLKILEKLGHHFNQKLFLRFHFIAFVISTLSCIFSNYSGSYLISLFLLVNYLHIRIKNLRIYNFSFSYVILFITLFSISSLLVVYQNISQRDQQLQKLRAENLSTEHDPVAELYLRKMQLQFYTDSIIPRLIEPPFLDLETYLNRNYFDGYFRNFDIQYTFCTSSDNLIIRPENTIEPCFPYFEKMISDAGISIPGSNFFFMTDMNGRVSYIGNIHYPLIEGGFSIFIELNSKVHSEGIGFPELLLEQSLIKPLRYKYLSYAKYYKNELVGQSGDYSYNYYLQSYNLDNLQFEFNHRKWDKFDHLIYKIDEDNLIIVSNQPLQPIDYLISFPYIFVFYLAFVLAVLIIGNPNFRKLLIPKDLRFRIQASIITLVLVSLLFVAAGTIYYNIQEYKIRHQYDLQEKMKSISKEIDNRLNNVDYITPELIDWLYRELNKLSNIFLTDVNIYAVNGQLLATSRPEIFRKGITSEMINSVAFYQLSGKYLLNFYQPEKIGKLTYLSAYKPVINNKGNYLAYLNLPYFTREDDLNQSISTFVVAFINLYLLLFLASVIIAVFLSNQITLPLSLIREKLKSIQLGKKNEPINYLSNDEIGELVKEYNHKVEELAISAEMLAKSERESAWREMAKQVAHEIKNPLTPMKLNIQYLQRAKTEKMENYNEFFDKVTRTLIEQIDTLSDIATEFSNFAQLPNTKNEKFDLALVLSNLCDLFEPTNNLEFSFNFPLSGSVIITSNKEQLTRAFLNLIKNSIQSIPPEQIGEINIGIKLTLKTAIVNITDNGSGISPEVQEHLFEPNFTTKTSGMGLGLSIAKNIINTCKGEIWYETALGIGTSFFIEIPLDPNIDTADTIK